MQVCGGLVWMQRRSVRVVHLGTQVGFDEELGEARREVEGATALCVLGKRQRLHEVFEARWHQLTEVFRWWPVLELHDQWVAFVVFRTTYTKREALTCK